MPALQIDYRPIESLTAYARNARTHSDEQVAQIAASIPDVRADVNLVQIRRLESGALTGS